VPRFPRSFDTMTRHSLLFSFFPHVSALTCGGALLLAAQIIPSSPVFASSLDDASSGRFSIKAPCGILTVSAIADGAMRVRCAPDDSDPPSSLVLIHPDNMSNAKLKRQGSVITLTSSKMSAAFDLKSKSLVFRDASGKMLLSEEPGGSTVRESIVQGQKTLAVEDRFVSQDSEHLFGSGEFQDGYLDIHDLPRRLTQVNTQISIPFLISSKGYGLLWHNYGLTDLNPADNRVVLKAIGDGTSSTESVTTTDGARTETRRSAIFAGDVILPKSGMYAMMLDIGQAMARRYRIDVDGKTVIDFSNRWLPPTTSWRMDLSKGRHELRVEGDAKDHPSIFWRPSATETVLRSPVSRGVDYVVFAGPRTDDILATYRRLSGEAPLLPMWAYGFIQCRERYNSSDEILENAKGFRDRGLPMDVIVQDWQYWGKYGWNAMKFDEANYPDPAALVRQLHEMHAELMVSVWSRIDPSTEIGREFAEKGYYIPQTQWVDFFNPDAAALYWKDFSQHMLSLGIDGWWQDATEPENDDLAGRSTAAGPGEAVRLLFPLFVNKTVYEGQRKDAPAKRVFILTRSAFLGQQRYASVTWSGDIGNDWETLRRQIPAGLNFSVTGLPYWTTDTGGFFRPGEKQYSDPSYHERFLRWLQFSTFTPLQRVHGYQTKTELWRYGKDVEDGGRIYLELRERLLPYIYSTAADVTLHGSTMMRPLVMDFPLDERAEAQKYEYMFGRSFLVAPVLQPGTSRWDVYAPDTPGGWFDWWTEKHVEGGASSSTDAPLNQIPLFIRAGSLVPLGPKEQYVGQDRTGNLELRVYPGADGDFTLYEDEGTNYNYEKGKRATIAMHWDNQSRTLTLGERSGSFDGMLKLRRIIVHLAGGLPADNKVVAYDGKSMQVKF
jgi:alpha-D-xyloside xylohydrolase